MDCIAADCVLGSVVRVLLPFALRGVYLSSNLFACRAKTATLCDGFMESSGSERVEIPANFEEAPIEHLVQLIGTHIFIVTRLLLTEVLQQTC